MEEEKVISISDIFRIIFSQKWLALIVALVITVLGVIGFTYLYNPSVSEYTVRFSINMPGGSDGTYYLYPDGKILYYNSIISEENLLKIQENDMLQFGVIDVEDMITKGNIKLSSEVKDDADGTIEPERLFVVTAKKSCFNSDEQASAFLRAVAEVPVNYFKNMSVDADPHLNFNRAEVNYDTEVNNLKNQIEFLKSEYRTLVNSYGYNFIVEIPGSANRSLQSYLIDLDNFLSETRDFETILSVISNNGYVKNEAAKAKYRIELTELEREYKNEKATLDNVMSVTVTDNTQVIQEQTRIVNALSDKIEEINRYLNGSPSKEIEASIDALHKQVDQFTETYKKVLDSVYGKLSFVTYNSVNVISSVGGVGLVTSIVICLLVGIVIALITAYIVGFVKYKKKNARAATVPAVSEEPPAAVPYVAEAAPSEQNKENE